MRAKLKPVLVFSVLFLWIGFFVVRVISFNEPKAASFTARAALNETRGVEEIQGYKTWTRVNPQPVNMDAAVAQLCAAPSGPKAADRNPHLHKFITVYVNQTGRSAMFEESGAPNFPQGSIIVKEKLAQRDSTSPELLTVMIKREKGFNPQNGDWEFMVTDGAGREVQARGKLESCQACHVSMSANDFIYRTYLPASTRSSLR